MCPGPAVARWAPGQMDKPEAAQHVGQVYSHLPHTEPSYPKQNGKEQKQELVSPQHRREQAQREGREADGQMDTQPTLWKCLGVCECSEGGRGSSWAGVLWESEPGLPRSQLWRG